MNKSISEMKQEAADLRKRADAIEMQVLAIRSVGREYPTEGDYFHSDPYSTNPLLLVNVAYGKDEWQLLGMGAAPNSNEFYRVTHTREEIMSHLVEQNMKFVGNISPKIQRLITDPNPK